MDEIAEKETPYIIKADLSRNFHEAIDRAAGVLLSGGIVCYPTESFYGLAVDATNEQAIRRLFLVKKRQTNHPILILIPGIEVLDRYVDHISPVARQFMEAFWPGGLTLLFQAGPNISPLLTADTGKIGIRLSNHPVATELARATGAPITGTSANPSGRPAGRNALEVLHSFQKGVDLILDGGETKGGKGSTVLDVTVNPPKILREGMVTIEQIKGSGLDMQDLR